jgi:hypothetical protein
MQRHPGPLVLSVAALHFFVYAFLDFALEDSGPGRLVEVGDFEDVGRIDPVVGAAAHDVVAGDVELVDGDLQKGMLATIYIFRHVQQTGLRQAHCREAREERGTYITVGRRVYLAIGQGRHLGRQM